ncbi:MAG TPA: LCP family protein [Actinomycetota bacterium]
MKGAEELLREVQELLKKGSAQAPAEAPPAPPDAAPTEPAVPPAPPPPTVVDRPGVPHPPPVRPRRALRHHPPPRPRRRWLRGGLAALLAAALAAGAVVAVVTLRAERRTDGPGGQAAPLPPQEVVAWTVWHQKPRVSFVTVVAHGQGLDPVILGVPVNTVATIPGRGLGTVEDASGTGDARLVGTMVSSVLGVRVDHVVATSLEDVSDAVDRVGGVRAGGQTVDGPGLLAMLTQRKVDRELRFLRWQEAARSLLASAADAPEALRRLVPDRTVPVFRAVGAEAPAPLELPVEDVGSGLVRPVKDEVAALVGEWFVPTAMTGRSVRLIILNGNGVPGIGERVARLLVPAGFRLVSSQNASTFEEETTLIVISDQRFRPEAELARDLLGVGRVVIDPQPTSVADVTVVVGRDFRGR